MEHGIAGDAGIVDNDVNGANVFLDPLQAFVGQVSCGGAQDECFERFQFGNERQAFVADADLLNAALWGTEGTANESAILRLVDRVATDKLF